MLWRSTVQSPTTIKFRLKRSEYHGARDYVRSSARARPRRREHGGALPGGCRRGVVGERLRIQPEHRLDLLDRPLVERRRTEIDIGGEGPVAVRMHAIRAYFLSLAGITCQGAARVEVRSTMSSTAC